jgi:hypothetical protein
LHNTYNIKQNASFAIENLLLLFFISSFMSETFILQLIWSIMLFILGLAAVYFVGLKSAAKKVLENSRILQAKMARMELKPKDFVSEGLGTMGIEGLLNEFGIDPSILNNPMVKGLVAKYAPRVLEQVSKTKGGTQGGNSYSL